MKKIVIASDSFKESMSSLQIARIAKETIHRFDPKIEVVTIPIADGGEGTVDCFKETMDCEPITLQVFGPSNNLIVSSYVLFGDTAVIEMAAAAGLGLVREKNPMITSTYGVGELIKNAVYRNVKHILLGLGGSATNDGGCGAAAALGTRFYNEKDELFVPSGGTLKDIVSIDNTETEKLLKDVDITVMCDVSNTFYGKNGAAYIFGPQKGADEKTVELLDQGLRHLNDILKKDLKKDVSKIRGSGAAGGMGGGCIAFFNGKLRSGIEAILDVTDFEDKIENADLIITGEGRLDSQSLQGKVISGITKSAEKKNVPVIAIVGNVKEDVKDIEQYGLTAIYETNPKKLPFEQVKDNAQKDYKKTLKLVLKELQNKERD